MTYEPPTEEEYECELAFTHHGGAAAAIEDCAGYLRAASERYFSYGHSDSAAHLLRDLAKEFMRCGVKERDVQQTFNRQGGPYVDR